MCVCVCECFSKRVYLQATKYLVVRRVYRFSAEIALSRAKPISTSCATRSACSPVPDIVLPLPTCQRCAGCSSLTLCFREAVARQTTLKMSVAERVGSVGNKLPWTSRARTGLDNVAEKIGKVCAPARRVCVMCISVPGAQRRGFDCGLQVLGKEEVDDHDTDVNTPLKVCMLDRAKL